MLIFTLLHAKNIIKIAIFKRESWHQHQQLTWDKKYFRHTFRALVSLRARIDHRRTTCINTFRYHHIDFRLTIHAFFSRHLSKCPRCGILRKVQETTSLLVKRAIRLSKLSKPSLRLSSIKSMLLETNCLNACKLLLLQTTKGIARLRFARRYRKRRKR